MTKSQTITPTLRTEEFGQRCLALEAADAEHLVA
jgi:hypothetical protein